MRYTQRLAILPMTGLQEATTAALRKFAEQQRLSVTDSLTGEVEQFDEETGNWRTVFLGGVRVTDHRGWRR